MLPQRRCAVLLTADLVLDATDESRPLSAGERPRFACIDNTLMVLRRHPRDEEPPPGTSARLAPFDLDAASGALVDLCEGKPDVRLAGEELTSLRLNYQDVSSRERLLSLAWLNPSSGPGLYLYDECDSRSPFFFDLSYGESYLSDGVTFAEYPRASLSLANSTAVSYPRAASRCRLSSSTSLSPPVHLWGLSLNDTWRSWLSLELDDPSDARAPFSAWLNIAWDDAERVNDLGELNTLAAHCAPQRSFYLGVLPRSAPELRRHIYTRFDHTRGLFYCSLSAQGDCALHSWSYPRHADVPRGARVFVDGEPLTLPAARFDALGGFLVYEVPGDAPPYAPLLKVAYSPSPAEGVDGTERLEYLSRGEVSTSGLELGQLELLYAPKEGSQGFKERVVWLYWVERVDRVNEQRVKESSWRLRAEPLAPPGE